MCFKTFTGDFRSFMGFSPKPHNSKLQDRAEDISFEEVKVETKEQQTKEQPKIDEPARAKQIAKAIDERVSELVKKSPSSGLLYITAFIAGANWADEHPRSNYNDRTAWIAAQHEEVQRLVKGASISKDYLFEAILFATFADGAMWANDNPAPTL